MSEWLGYPDLKKDDIETGYIKDRSYAENFVSVRNGRVIVVMDSDSYQKFLAAVRRRFGDIAHHHVNEAALRALKEWTERNT